MGVEHGDGDSQDTKVNDVVRVADDILIAPHPPVAAAMSADPDDSNKLQEAATMADVYFLSKTNVL